MSITKKSTYKSKAINLLKMTCKKILVKIKKDEDEKITPKYYDFAPTDKLEKGSQYLETLNWALNNPNIYNLALTGTYGSGKSSILRAYQAENSNKYKFLNVSLSSFKEKKQKVNVGSIPDLKKKEGSQINDADVEQFLVERSILQEIFYKVKNKKIQYSKFNRIINLKRRTIFLYCCIFFGILITGGFLFYPDELLAMTKNPLIKEIPFPEEYTKLGISLLFLTGLGFLTLVAVILIKILKFINKLRITNFEFLDSKIKLGTGEEKHLLNHYLDEIFYFFDVNHFDVVIFEDLDRYDNIKILTKIREINILLNDSDQFTNRPIVFIYAIRDDLFVNKDDRLKFFDFIIPIIPVIHSSNSAERFLVLFKDFIKKGQLSRQLIFDVSLYVNDMRLVHSIFNELQIYQENMLELKQLDKLFAFIVYKNLYPDDFSKLQNNEGIIYRVFENKKDGVQDRIKVIDTEIVVLRTKLDILENEIASDINELRKILAFNLSEAVGYGNSIKINNRRMIDPFAVLNEQEFKLIKANYNQFGKIEQQMQYTQRENKIKEGKGKQILEFQKGIDRLEKEKKSAILSSLKELILKHGTEKFLKDEIQKEKLLVYLIRNGSIDENYKTYLSYFYSGTLTLGDHEFRLSITDQKAFPFDFELKNIDKILSKLNLNNFKQKEVYNYFLLDYLLLKKKYPEYLSELLTQLSDEEDQSIEFIFEYIDQGQQSNIFIETFCKFWPNIWNYIEINSKFDPSRKNKYLKLIIDNANIFDIEKIDSAEDKFLLSKYLSKIDDFSFMVRNPMEIKKLTKVLEKLQIKILNLKVGQSILDEISPNIEILDFIYKNNLYEINFMMIKIIIRNKGNLQNDDVLQNANYTAIKKSNCRNLIDYIDANIDEYIRNVFLVLESNKYESEDSIMELLNNENIDSQSKEEIIRKEDKKITILFDVDTSLWIYLLENNKVSPVWINVLYYYTKIIGFDESLITFLNNENNLKELLKSDIDLISTYDLYEAFLVDLINLENIHSDMIIKILPPMIKFYHEHEEDHLRTNINTVGMKRLIEYNFFNFTSENYQYIRGQFDPLHIEYLKKNIDTYISAQEDFELEIDDVLRVLELIKLTIESIIKMINYFDWEEATEGQIRILIFDILEPYLLDLPPLDNDLLEVIFSHDIELDAKIKVFTSQIKYIDDERITELLSLLGEKYSKIGQQKQVWFELSSLDKNKTTEIIEGFANELKNAGYISKYRFTIKKIAFYSKIGVMV